MPIVSPVAGFSTSIPADTAPGALMARVYCPDQGAASRSSTITSRPGPPVPEPAAVVAGEEPEQAEPERDQREDQADEATTGAAEPQPRRAVVVLDPDRDQAHARRLPGGRPEDQQVGGSEHDPGAEPEDEPRSRDPVGVAERGDDEAEQRGDQEEDPVEDHAVDEHRHRARDQADVLRGLAARAPDQPPEDALEPVVELHRHVADLAADVAQQADALGGDRRPDLGRLGDPLDQLLDLVRRRAAAPRRGRRARSRAPRPRPARPPGWRACAGARPAPRRTRAPARSPARPPGSRARGRSSPRSPTPARRRCPSPRRRARRRGLRSRAVGPAAAADLSASSPSRT